MKAFLILFLTIIPIALHCQTLRQELLKKYPKYNDVEITKCKSDPTLFIAVLVQDLDWWEDLTIVRYADGKIQWQAAFDSLPVEQSIRSTRQISLKGFANPLIEVYGETHMGNGFFYLYEINGKTARQLVMARAVDNHLDGSVEIKGKQYSRLYKGGILKPTYNDLNNDGIADVKLTGTAEICDDEKLPVKTIRNYPVQRVFVYNKKKKRYVEIMKLRKGVDEYD